MSFLSVKEVQKWLRADVIKFLQEQNEKETLYLDDKHIRVIQDQDVTAEVIAELVEKVMNQEILELKKQLEFLEGQQKVASSVCSEKVQIYPEEYIEGKYGYGPVDFCMVLKKSIIISVLEVEKEDFIQGTAQIIVQLHSSFESYRKRKYENDDFVIDKTFGIVTDSRFWYFSSVL
ncbi:hypothetical protein C2G38_2048115 [Gigaspora rosea]|uniref:Uncharacterized protein n=1 Tax=Gigaspora rosea TaxID=44941 RepID=A0A397U3G2_9GLOM|nr:hypothetical protein C2G38_2048115 [Gigaspora rosea]